MSEDQFLSSLSVENVRTCIEHICRNIPSRLAGSENGRRMAEYSAAQLHEAGVEASVHDLPGLVSFPEKAELRVLAPREIAIEANTLGHSVATLTEGISGELLYVGSGAFSEYENKDATGKITLSELSYHPARHEKQRIAGLKRSTGCIMMNWGHPENAAVPFGSVKPAWGNPTPATFQDEMPTLPCVGIARTAGLALKEMAAQGPVRVWFRTNVENGWRRVQITTGQIRSERSDDFVVVGGHQDSWPGEQATDNAAGSACIIELARIFNKRRGELRRGLTFGLWTGHETGTMVGSTWFVDQNWDRLRKHAIAYLQIDQPACVGTSVWGTSSNAELRRFHERVEKRLLGGREIGWRRAAKTGDSSFFGLGIPMFAGLTGFTRQELEQSALANLGWWHHSVENTLDKVDWDLMPVHLSIYAACLWELCTAVVLPFEFIPVAEQMVGRLNEFKAMGESVGIASLIEQAEAFRGAAERLDGAAETWRARYKNAQARDEAAADLLNDCMKKLSRTLVPIQSTAKGTYGHDPYGYTPQGSMIPALFEMPELATLPDGDPVRWMKETHLMRARNKIADALTDCTDLIDKTLRQLS